MTKSQNVVGLAIISINDGRELGTVRDLIVNPDQGAVEFLMVENETWYLGAQVIPFHQLQGVGEYAVTIESEDALKRLTDLSEVQSLIQRNVKIKGTKVLTKRGRLVGLVSEYFIDVSSGKITGCLLIPSRESLGPRIIPADHVVTYGRDVLVVAEEIDETSLETFTGEAVTAPMVSSDTLSFNRSVEAIPPLSSGAVTAGSPSTEERPSLTVLEDVSVTPETVYDPVDIPVTATMNATPPVSKPNEPAVTPLPVIEEPTLTEELLTPEVNDKENTEDSSAEGALFGQLQHKYYVGKKLTKRIENNLGELLADEGTVITEELIDSVKQAGKYLELIMNVKD